MSRPSRPPAVSGGKRRARRLPPQVLEPEEVLLLMQACNPATFTGVRHRALIAVLYRTGLRIHEALTLLPRCVDERRGLLRVDYGKGGRSRVVGMDPGAWAELRRWQDLRAQRGLGVQSPLFCTQHGHPISDAYIRRLLPRLALQAGIPRRVHAHALRHTHAAELRFEGLDIGLIAKQLGHASIATTARYLDHIAPLSVVEAMRRRQWDCSIDLGLIERGQRNVRLETVERLAKALRVQPAELMPTVRIAGRA
ncbi:MAG: phage integrase family protein [Phycisphaeraceae bacterium]|nr:phage integrase family protein [Phycisphaeraceae bacterium]